MRKDTPAQQSGVDQDNGRTERHSSQPEAPPPPYESVVMNSEVLDTREAPGQSSQVPAAAPGALEITVIDPVKQGDSVGAYVSYKVCTKTNLQHYKARQSEVIRRFRDFAWLHDRLAEQNRGIIIPPLPEKNVVQKYQMTTEFIEQRRRALAVFINRVASHPVLQPSEALRAFLEASEEDFALEVSRAAHEAAGGGAKKKLASTLQLFRDLGTSTANLMSGRSPDEEEDPEYLKVREYMVALEGHLGEAHRQAQRLLKRQADLGGAFSEFGVAMQALGALEQGHLATSFAGLGDKAAVVASTSQKQAEELGGTFEAPLRESVRAIKAVQAVVADRGAALATVQQARADVDAKRGKLARLRGVAGIKEDKVAEAERELLEATNRTEAAKKVYETIIHRMSQELSRFQKERALETSHILHSFAVAQAQLASDHARLWRSLLQDSSAPNGVAKH